MRPLVFAQVAALAALPAVASAEVPSVVADIAVVQSLAQTVLGELGQARVLVPPGASAHSYQMRPSDAAALHDAGLVFWVGEALTPWLGRVVDGTGLRAKTVELLEAPGTYLREFGAGGDHDHGHDAPVETATATDAPADEHHEGVDPHAWLDPANARAWLAAIADELAAADPVNAATYAANADAADRAIVALDAELAAALAPIAGRPFVVFHDAYGYFSDHFALNVAGAVNLGDATAPGAAHLTELRASLTAGGVVCAFPETGHDSSQLVQMLEGTAVRVGAPLDPAGSALAAGAGHYAATLRGIATSLVDCLAPR